MTIALFIKAGQGAQGGDRVFTNNLEDPTKSFQMNIGNNGLVLAVDPNETGEFAERTLYLEDNSGHDRSFLQEASGWFHVIASTEGADGEERAANFRIWVNGVDRTENLMPDATGWGIDTDMAKIGGRKEDPRHTTTHSGGQGRGSDLARPRPHGCRSTKSLAGRHQPAQKASCRGRVPDRQDCR